MPATDSDDAFGRWLQARRRALNLTQCALAEKTCIDVRLICKYESGRTVPRRANRQLLLEALADPRSEEATPPNDGAQASLEDRIPDLPEFIDDEETWCAFAGLAVPLVGSRAARLLVTWRDKSGLAAIVEAPDRRLVTIRASASSSSPDDIESLRALVDRLARRVQGQRPET